MSDIVISGLDAVVTKFRTLSLYNSTTEAKVEEVVRKVLGEVRRSMQDAARGVMDSDPRSAYKAVRSMVYRRVLGGNVSILDGRRGRGVLTIYEPPRRLRPGQWGGNRRVRSERTARLMSYQGRDRAFILRFINNGTKGRNTRYGFRGAITGRDWFGQRSQNEMEAASVRICQMIDKYLAQVAGV